MSMATCMECPEDLPKCPAPDHSIGREGRSFEVYFSPRSDLRRWVACSVEMVLHPGGLLSQPFSYRKWSACWQASQPLHVQWTDPSGSVITMLYYLRGRANTLLWCI